jgi:hypothetical protein
MIDGNTRKILKRRVHQIVVAAYPTDTGVWMIAGNDRIT